MPETTSKKRWRFIEESSYFRFYFWKYRRWIGIGLVALVVVDVLDIIPPLLLKSVVDVTVSRGSSSHLVQMALAYLVVSLIQGACRYLWRMYLVRSSLLAGRDLRGQYAQHLFGLSVSFFDRHRMGDLMSLATNDVESVRIALGTGLLVFADAIFYLLTVPVAMWFLSPRLTLLCCLPLPLIPLIVMKNEKAVHERFEKVQDCFGKIFAMSQENLNGMRVIKAFAQENVQYRRLKELGEHFIQLNLKLARIQSTTGPSMDFVMSMGLITLLFVGGGTIIQKGEVALTLGTFVAFQRYIQKMIWPMAAVGMAVNYYQKSISSSNRLKRVFAVQTDVPETQQLPSVAPRSRTPGAIEMKNLSFSFPGSKHLVLSEINLKIEPGERVAFVGGVGSGKSALLGLVPRLYPVSSGMLFVDGVDVNHWSLEELRKQVGYVSQDVYLFSESVFENIAYGLHDWAESGVPITGYSHLIEEASKMASIHDEVLGLNLAYQTRLGERGMSLSGGQKQRLTLARALVKAPAILVLDDPLASIDLLTEEKILGALRSRQKNTEHKNTELIAAHRVSTIKDSDRIVVLRNGKIVQTGSHVQLVGQKSGDYRKFFELQKVREELESYQDELGKFN